MKALRPAARIARVGGLALMLAVGLSACIFDGGDGSVGNLIHIHDGTVSIRGRDDTTARIEADGDLRIAGKAVALTPAQRALTTQYVEQVQATLRDGIATGKAGAAMAGSVIGAVFSGLAHGDTRDIDRKANAQAAGIDRHVARICDDMQAIQTTQNQLAAQLPAFAPYTVINDRRVGECRSGLHDH
ncbi:MAG: DUF2884 family protein [Xanthomonadaceae bacterium]|nr:DUF2884 family protein [Xanthomonadaceae bacterium]